jgi:putative peptide zinc metalloprotease protein
MDLFSRNWYRVAELRPRLRNHAAIERHLYRGEVWFVLTDPLTARVHRFTPAAYQVIAALDGARTMDEVWRLALERLGDEAPSQDEVLRLLAQLHAADLLAAELPPDLGELERRGTRTRRRKLLQYAANPLSLKFPLFDPDRLLARLAPFYAPLFSRAGAILWLALVGGAAVLAAEHWTDLTGDFADRILAPQNLLVLALVFPLVKALHELGHACAVKAWGGQVHELGVMLLVLMPIPYVDASAASGFPDKRRRVVVGAAGMMVELALAAVALVVWLNVEPGLVRMVAYDVMMIAGISTVFFNGNPLLRFDGYYILADLLEMPNLRARAGAMLRYYGDRYVLGVAGAEPPEAAAGARRWLVAFGVASGAYRVFIAFVIALFLAGHYYFLGVALALLAVVGGLVFPLGKWVAYVAAHPGLRAGRARAVLGNAVVLLVLGALLFAVPFPQRTRAEGVVAVVEDAQVRAGTEGFVKRVVADPGARVARGDLLVELEDPLAAAAVREKAGRVAELETRLRIELVRDPARTGVVREQLATARADLARAQERAAELRVVSRREGVWVMPVAADLPDRFMKKGASLGYLLDGSSHVARVIVAQGDVDLVRYRTVGVGIRLAGSLDRPAAGRLVREIPRATSAPVNAALTTVGGGAAALDPTDPMRAKTLDTWFEFEIALPGLDTLHVGERVFVRFDHGYTPLGLQWYRAARQLLLRRLNV